MRQSDLPRTDADCRPDFNGKKFRNLRQPILAAKAVAGVRFSEAAGPATALVARQRAAALPAGGPCDKALFLERMERGRAGTLGGDGLMLRVEARRYSRAPTVRDRVLTLPGGGDSLALHSK